MSNNFFLVRVSVRQWSARKLDRAASGKAKASSGAADKAGVKVYKTVIAADELETIVKIASAAGSEHRKRTVPWTYEGVGCITAEGYPAYKAAMLDYERQFNAAVARFVAVYAEEREAARAYLGDLFNAGDYPSTLEIASRFGFTTGVEPMPQADAFNPRGLPQEVVDEIKADIIENNEAAIGNANHVAWSRVVEKVEFLKLRLEEYKRGDVTRFYDGWVDNVAELAALIPSINIAADPELTRIGQRMLSLTLYSADELRDDKKLCEAIAREAGQVLAGVSDAYRKAA